MKAKPKVKTITVRFNPKEVALLERLVQTGLFGRDVADCVDRIVSEQLRHWIEYRLIAYPAPVAEQLAKAFQAARASRAS